MGPETIMREHANDDDAEWPLSQRHDYEITVRGHCKGSTRREHHTLLSHPAGLETTEIQRSRDPRPG